MIKREDIPDLKMNIDPNLKDDTILEKNENEINYHYIKENLGIKKSEPIRLLVYWDDICQLTSLGLIETLNSLFKTNALVDIEHFLTRPNEYDYGMKYVYKLFENICSKEDINKIKRELYWSIMQISLKTELFIGLTRMNSCFSQLGFYFPFHFSNCEQLRIELDKMFFTDHGMNNGVKFYYASSGVSFNDTMKQNCYNSIITPNIASTYAYIIQNKMKKITIMGPDAHNGLTPEMYELFYKYRKFPRPNYCSVSTFQEKIVIN